MSFIITPRLSVELTPAQWSLVIRSIDVGRLQFDAGDRRELIAIEREVGSQLHPPE